MKSIGTTVILVVISLTLSSQIVYDTSFTRQWNSKTNEWENFDRIIYSYDHGLVTSEMIQVRKNDQWVNYNFKAYYYNSGRLVEEFEQYWNDTKLKWEDNYRKLYSYDSEGKLTQITHQNIFKGKYINTSKEIHIYSSDGQLKEKIIQKFNHIESGSEKAWSNFLRYQYYYNSNDILINENLAEWSKDSWNGETYSYNYVYDRNGNLTEKIKCRNEGQKSRFISKETFTYNLAEHTREHNISVWNFRKKEWQDRSRASYVNNNVGNIVSVVLQQKSENHWENQYFANYSGNFELRNDFIMDDLMTFAVFPSDYGDNAMVMFSNPYNDLYYVSIINADGLILGTATTDQNQIFIDTINLYKGSYYLELQGSNLYSGKFSIE